MSQKTTRILGLAMTLAAALAASGWAQSLSEEPGVNRRGSDYDKFSTSRHGECRQACARDRRCRAYTFNSVDSLCYLKDRVPGTSQDSRTISGVKDDDRYPPDSASGLSEEPGINRPGSDYNRFSTSRHGECRVACARDRRCRAYTYNSVDALCYLKDRVPGTSRDSKTISGVKDDDRYPPDSASGLSEEPGINRPGSDYDRFSTSRHGECRVACARDRRCRAYTYNRDDRLCYLKDRVPGTSRDSRTVSGVKGGGGSGSGGGWLSEERGVDFKGGDYTDFQSRGLDDCKDQCRRDSRCVAYTYALRSGTCYLKDRVVRRESDQDKVSGTKDRD